jgi:hypothetical protein
MEESVVHAPVLSIIAAGPDETVPQGIAWETALLPSLHTAEVESWVERNRSGEVYVVPGVDIASEGTRVLPVHVTEDEYLMVTSAMPR